MMIRVLKYRLPRSLTTRSIKNGWRRNLTTTGETPANKGRLIQYLGVGGVLFALGTYAGANFIGSSSGSKVSSNKDSSTTRLSDIESPVYATDEEFKIAVSKMIKIVGEKNISYDELVIASHSDSFYSTHHPPEPEKQKPHVVIYPSSTEEVSEIMKVAHKYRVPVVAGSGLTSLEGQNMHTRGPNSISLSFGHLNEIVDFHPDDMDVVVQPGTGWQDLDEFLKSREDGKHLIFGPDPGMGATIAGMVSTSASGTNAYRYGTMKENVINLTVVLPDGRIIKTKQRPRKSSAGYDMTRLFIGAEGTLGIITEITLKLNVRTAEELVSIATFPTIKDAAKTALDVISKSGIQPNALEILDGTMMSFVNESTSGLNQKVFIEKPTLFFKIGGINKNVIEEQVKVIKTIAEENLLIKFENSTNEEQNEVLWSARRSGLWSTIDYGKKILEDKDDIQIWTTDIAIPVSNLSQVISETNDDLNNSGFYKKFSVMGHIGDGNCHFLILYNSKDYAKTSAVVDRLVYRALKYEGTCTGEHGVGVGKRRYLPTELGDGTIDLMRQIKLLIDPRRILNPDKIFKIDPADNLDELLEKGSIIDNSKPCCH